MNYRQLGATGLKVSEIGFGTWGLGGASSGAIAYGPTDDKESDTALRRAFDLGINFYDTSDLYGYGHSEELLGRAFKSVRTRVIIASKVGFLNASGQQDFSPQHIKTAVEGSLRRLQTDYVDLYQLHNPPVDLLERDDGALRTLEVLKTEGKIRAMGISVRSPDEALVAVREYGFKSIQVNFNMVDQRALENGLMELRDREKIGLICRTPLCFGFLTGKYFEDTEFDNLDHRSTWPVRQRVVWANAYRSFIAVANNQDQTRSQFALRFCLSYPFSSVIPGMLNHEQVEENVVASRLGCLTEKELLGIKAIYLANTFFLGKS